MSDRFDHTLEHTLESKPDDDGDDTVTSVRRIELITGTGRRRRWSEDDKARIVVESLRSGANVSEVARRHGLSPQQLTGTIRDLLAHRSVRSSWRLFLRTCAWTSLSFALKFHSKRHARKSLRRRRLRNYAISINGMLCVVMPTKDCFDKRRRLHFCHSGHNKTVGGCHSSRAEFPAPNLSIRYCG